MQDMLPFFADAAHPYGLAIAVASFLLLLLMGAIGYRRGLPVGTARVFGILAIPLGVIFSRLVFCLFNLPLFLETYENPWLMLRFFDGGLSMCGLLIGLLLAASLTARLLRLSLGKLLDVLTLPLGLFVAICRAAEGLTELGVGKVIEEGFWTQHFPWLFLTESAGIATEYRLAVYRYEALAGLLLFAFMACLARSLRKDRGARNGDSALLFFSLYGATQMILESMRDDGHMLIIFLRVSQVLAALMPVVAAAIFTKRYITLLGRAGPRIILSWGALLACIIAGILLEFSLDGRLSWGNPSLQRDYAIMVVLCVILFAIPYSLFHTLRKKRYGKNHITVRMP